MKSKLPDNIPPPRCVVPCGGSWWANNRCCARLKNSAARRDAQKVEHRESADVSVTAGPALEKCDRAYICVGFRALWRAGRELELEEQEAEVKGKLHAGGGLSRSGPEHHLHIVVRLEMSPELTASLGSG